MKQLVSQIPWGHLIRLLQKVKDPAERTWYIRQTIEHGWSRNVLVHQIESKLYHRQGRAITNFERTLPAPQSDLARALVKDPYVFDFLTLGPQAQERDLERSLLEHLRDFLLELGRGFAFVGSQYRLEVGGNEFYRLAAPIDDLILANTRESRTLAQIRDVLLPELLNGETRMKSKETA